MVGERVLGRGSWSVGFKVWRLGSLGWGVEVEVWGLGHRVKS